MLTIVVLVVFVVVAFIQGLEASIVSSGDRDAMLVYAQSAADSIENSAVTAGTPALLAASVDGIQRPYDATAVSPELFLGTRVALAEGESNWLGLVRGETATAPLVRRSVRIVEGRWPGAGEILVCWRTQRFEHGIAAPSSASYNPNMVPVFKVLLLIAALLNCSVRCSGRADVVSANCRTPARSTCACCESCRRAAQPGTDATPTDSREPLSPQDDGCTCFGCLCNGAILPDSTAALPSVDSAPLWDDVAVTAGSLAALPVGYTPRLLGPPGSASFPGWTLCIEQQCLLL